MVFIVSRTSKQLGRVFNDLTDNIPSLFALFVKWPPLNMFAVLLVPKYKNTSPSYYLRQHKRTIPLISLPYHKKGMTSQGGIIIMQTRLFFTFFFFLFRLQLWIGDIVLYIRWEEEVWKWRNVYWQNWRLWLSVCCRLHR